MLVQIILAALATIGIIICVEIGRVIITALELWRKDIKNKHEFKENKEDERRDDDRAE
jgi:hypothetical protein